MHAGDERDGIQLSEKVNTHDSARPEAGYQLALTDSDLSKHDFLAGILATRKLFACSGALSGIDLA